MSDGLTARRTVRTFMKIHYCRECGAYSIGPVTVCEECRADLSEDSWAEVTQDELRQLQYVDSFDLAPELPAWEYEVVRLKSDAEEGGVTYTEDLLNRMGEKGWELVNIVPLGDRDGPRYGVFKRAWDGAYGE